MTPAAAEFEAVDSETLYQMELDTTWMAILLERLDDNVDDIHLWVASITNSTGAMQSHTSQMNTNLFNMMQDIGMLVEHHIESPSGNLNMWLSGIPDLLTDLNESLAGDFDPDTYDPEPVPGTVPDFPLLNWNFVPGGIVDTPQALPTPAPYFELLPAPEDFEIEEQDLTIAPASRTGREDWTFNIPLSNLNGILGGSVSDWTFSTDLSWYDGAFRTAVHLAIIAVATLYGVSWVFEEMRRYA